MKPIPYALIGVLALLLFPANFAHASISLGPGQGPITFLIPGYLSAGETFKAPASPNMQLDDFTFWLYNAFGPSQPTAMNFQLQHWNGNPDGPILYQTQVSVVDTHFQPFVFHIGAALNPGETYIASVQPSDQSSNYLISGFQNDPYLDGTLLLGGNWEYRSGWDLGFSASFSAVPEASTCIAGALLLLPLGATTLRMLRRRQVA